MLNNRFVIREGRGPCRLSALFSYILLIHALPSFPDVAGHATCYVIMVTPGIFVRSMLRY